MPAKAPTHWVFLSGTNLDLGNYKTEAMSVFRRLGLNCKQQGDFQQTGLGTDAREWSEDLMQGTDWYVLIVAHRYGEVVTDPETKNPFSVTEMEYRHAVKNSDRRFVFLSHPTDFDDAAAMNQHNKLPSGGHDFGKAQQLETFRSTLTANHKVIDFFKNLADFTLKLERCLCDVLQAERDAAYIDDEDRITARFNALLARKKDLRRRVMDLDERFKLNQTRLTGVTLLKDMHDGIHIARQEAIRPLREVTFAEWTKNGRTDAVLLQLKRARSDLGGQGGLGKLGAFYEQFTDAAEQIKAHGGAFSNSKARFSDEMQEFFQALDFVYRVADDSNLPDLQNDLKSFVVVIERTFGLLNSELKQGAEMLVAKNDVIEAEVETALGDQSLRLSAADVGVVRDRIGLLQARTKAYYKIVGSHDDWQSVHDRLTELDGGLGSAGHAQTILAAVCGGDYIDRKLRRLVSERRAQLGALVIRQFVLAAASAPQSAASPYAQLRELRHAIKRNQFKATKTPGDARSTYLRLFNCGALASHLSRLSGLAKPRTGCETDDKSKALDLDVEDCYVKARKLFDDQFFDVDTELKVLCKELSAKVDESLEALRQIDLAAD